MKLSFIPLSFSLAAMASNSLCAFTTSFPVGTFGTLGMEVAGVDGWVINDPGSDNAPPNPLSFVAANINGSPAAALGGWNDVPLAGAPSTVYLSHSVNVGLQTASFSTQFAISASNFAFPGRDGFGFSFRNGSNNLLTISLVPVASLNNDAFQVRYTVGTETTLDAKDGVGDNMFIYHNGLYSLDFDFTPNGNDPTFSATISGTNAQTFTGTATGLGSAVISNFGAEWNTIPGQEGNNFIVFDNVSLVPEPSSALLLGLAGFAFVSRRKRA